MAGKKTAAAVKKAAGPKKNTVAKGKPEMPSGAKSETASPVVGNHVDASVAHPQQHRDGSL